VETREIFLAKDLTRDSKSITIAEFTAGAHQNDCLDVVSRRYQSVKNALQALSEFSESRLTGTGACVFAQFSSKEAAVSAYDVLKESWQVYLARGMNTSPLLSKLEISKHAY
jgi:4-diphosphocytidyl-2-C-methyl-D-erythritol kinase